MSFRAGQVLSLLVGCTALAAEPPVHASSSGSDADSAVPAHQKHPVDPKPPAPFPQRNMGKALAYRAIRKARQIGA